MNMPPWMIEATARAPLRAKSVRHNPSSTVRLGLNVVDVSLAFLAMLVTLWGIHELNALMLR
jgi:hypothetical protein